MNILDYNKPHAVRMIGTAVVGGDFSGDARGVDAVDIQTERTASTQVASGANSLAMGARNTADGDESMAAGWNNTANVFGSTAFGYQNLASGTGSIAGGYVNTASGQNSISLGNGNLASMQASVAMGYDNTASNSWSTAIGSYQNVASGYISIAMGYSNTASGSGDSAIGWKNTASGDSSVAVGYSNTASGYISIAMGYTNQALADNSTAVGRSNSIGTASVRSSAFGYSNSIGTGASDSTVVGFDNTIGNNAQFASAFGALCNVTASYSTALGYKGYARIEKTVNIGGGIINRKDAGEAGLFESFSGVEPSHMTDEIDLTSTGLKATITIPTGAKFFPKRAAIICSSLNGTLTSQASISLGITGDNDKLLAGTVLADMDVLHNKEEFNTLLSIHGESTLTVEVTVAAVLNSATENKGRIIFYGDLIEIQ